MTMKKVSKSSLSAQSEREIYQCTYSATCTLLHPTYVRKFRQDKELDPQAGGSTAVRSLGVKAQNFVNRICSGHVIQPGRRSQKANGTKGRQAKVPGRQGVLPAQTISLGKVLLSDHNHGPVQQTRRNRDNGVSQHPIANRDWIIPSLPAEVARGCVLWS